MAYLPIARKYRPQTFADLIGQPHISETLTRAIESSRLGQAYLFTGQRGVGKTSAARILSKCLNCSKGPTPKPCQKCPSCVSITQGSSLDVVEIDGASNRGIDEVRSLRETVKFAPTQGSFRIYIIDEVHMLTAEAFNALLKTLEEPPSHVKFIFATTSPQKVPSTIISRCQRFDFRRLDASSIVSALKNIGKSEKITVSESALYAIARSSEGSLRDAEVVLEQLVSFCDGDIEEEDVNQLLGTLESDALESITNAISSRNAKDVLIVAHKQLSQGKEPMQVLTGLISHLHDLLMIKTAAGSSAKADAISKLIDLAPEKINSLKKQAEEFKPEELLVMLQLLTGSYELARRSPFAQTVLELCLIRLSTKESWASVEELLQRLDKISQGTGIASSHKISSSQDKKSDPIKHDSFKPEEEHQEIEGSQGTGSGLTDSNEPSSRPASFDESPVSEPDLMQIWSRVLDNIAGKKMMIAACLSEAKLMSVKKDVVEIGLPCSSLHQEVFNSPEYLRIVESSFEAVVGKKITVKFTPLPANATSDAKHMQDSSPEGASYKQDSYKEVSPIVKDIASMFDAKIVPPSPSYS